MEALVIYASRYGSTKKYAETFAERHQLDVQSFDTIQTIPNVETIYYFGSLMINQINGLSKFMKKINLDTAKNIVIISVGMNNPNDPENVTHIREAALKHISESLQDKVTFIHLRGQINYRELKLLHRTIMFGRYMSSRDKDDPESKELVANYPDGVDYTDFNTLDQIPIFE